ncbi:hypothetical protein IPH25_03170 [bacterium]|nr:MAG: hypothetical protein IPG37_00160 [bacterium]QQR61468.1 MAG: hypothetical protein IPH25_03170 [bacterium]QQR63006.1 MAG: hypothetical protein IPH67_00840 [bacterium]
MKLFQLFFLQVAFLFCLSAVSEVKSESVPLPPTFLRLAMNNHLKITAISLVATIGFVGLIGKFSSLLSFLAGVYGTATTCLHAWFCFSFLKGLQLLKQGKDLSVCFNSSFIAAYYRIMTGKKSVSIFLKEDCNIFEIIGYPDQSLIGSGANTVVNNFDFWNAAPDPLDPNAYLIPFHIASWAMEKVV